MQVLYFLLVHVLVATSSCHVVYRTLLLLSADMFSSLQPKLTCVFCVFQVDKLQQADAERAEEMQEQQPPSMMSE